jgi:hypothetical protein
MASIQGSSAVLSDANSSAQASDKKKKEKCETTIIFSEKLFRNFYLRRCLALIDIYLCTSLGNLKLKKKKTFWMRRRVQRCDYLVD